MFGSDPFNAKKYQDLKIVWVHNSQTSSRLMIEGAEKSLVAIDSGFGAPDHRLVPNEDIYDSPEAQKIGLKEKLYEEGELIGYHSHREGGFGYCIVLKDTNIAFSVDVLIGETETTLMREETFRLKPEKE